MTSTYNPSNTPVIHAAGRASALPPHFAEAATAADLARAAEHPTPGHHSAATLQQVPSSTAHGQRSSRHHETPPAALRPSSAAGYRLIDESLAQPLALHGAAPPDVAVAPPPLSSRRAAAAVAVSPAGRASPGPTAAASGGAGGGARTTASPATATPRASPSPSSAAPHSADAAAVVGGVAAAAAAGPTPQPQHPEVKPVSIVFAERWRDKELAVAAASPFSHLPGWRLMPVIVKANDDLRQEQFVSQLLKQFASIFRRADVPVWIRPYDILATAPRGGLVQAISDTVSIDALKRGDPAFTTLDDWFERHFNYGVRGPERVRAARLNFVRSMAAYSVVCYLLNLKDRHNGNILIDRKGHILHIDFGFLLTSSPGGNMNFEAAPFKLTADFVAVMGGARSSLFGTFRKLCIHAFLAARKYRDRIIVLVEMMLSGNSDLSCFRGGAPAVMAGLRARFNEDASERACAMAVHKLIDQSLDNWRTRWYDRYQRFAQGIN